MDTREIITLFQEQKQQELQKLACQAKKAASEGKLVKLDQVKKERLSNLAEKSLLDRADRLGW